MNAGLHSFDTASPVALIEHILRRYHQPLPGQVAALCTQAQSLQKNPNEPVALLAQVLRLLNELWAELEPHLLKEERVLFPMIEAVVVAKESGRPPLPSPSQLAMGPIRVMRMEHDRADEILRALAELTTHYQAVDGASEPLRALYAGLKQVDDELREHIRIENDLLFPAVTRL